MLGSVSCSGRESSLLECEHEGINIHSCVHEMDASVICITSETERGNINTYQQKGYRVPHIMIIIVCYTIECVESELELTNVSASNDGSGSYLRVCVNGIWSAICGDRWGIADATVACRQLGIIEISSKNKDSYSVNLPNIIENDEMYVSAVQFRYI